MSLLKEPESGGFRPIDNIFYYVLSWLFYGGLTCLGLSLTLGPLYIIRFVDLLIMKVFLVGVSVCFSALIVITVFYFAYAGRSVARLG